MHQVAERQQNDPASLLMFLSSMLLYGTIGIFRRYIPLPSSVIACFRGASGALLLLMIALLRKKKLRNGIGRKKVAGLIVSGALIGFNWILLFEAYNYTTIAIATLCYYMQPTIVMLLSPIFFHERLTGKKALCAMAALIGMALVSGVLEAGGLAGADARGVLFGLGAAVLYATVVIMNKKLTGIDVYEKTIIQLASAAIVLVPYLLITSPAMDAEITPLIIGLLLIMGFVHTGVAYALYFGSMDGLKAQTAAILSYLDPILALLLAALVFHESLTLGGAVGAVLIIGAALVSEMTH